MTGESERHEFDEISRHGAPSQPSNLNLDGVGGESRKKGHDRRDLRTSIVGWAIATSGRTVHRWGPSGPRSSANTLPEPEGGISNLTWTTFTERDRTWHSETTAKQMGIPTRSSK